MTSETVTRAAEGGGRAAAAALGLELADLRSLRETLVGLRERGGCPHGAEGIAAALALALAPDDVQLADAPAIAAGWALAFAIRGEARAAVSLTSEGASARGSLHEAMNLAGVRRLPIVFVIDNDGFDGSTPAHLSFACGSLAERGPGYGMPGVIADGADVLAALRELRSACARARAGDGPTLIEFVRMPSNELAPDRLTAVARELDPIERVAALLAEAADADA